MLLHKRLINQSSSPRLTPLIVEACCIILEPKYIVIDLQVFQKKEPLPNNSKKDNTKMILRNFTKILILTTFFLSLFF